MINVGATISRPLNKHEHIMLPDLRCPKKLSLRSVFSTASPSPSALYPPLAALDGSASFSAFADNYAYGRAVQTERLAHLIFNITLIGIVE